MHLIRIVAVTWALTFGCNNLAFGQTTPQGAFIADQKSGCKVWNPNPKSVEKIIWFGACVNGFADGSGRLQWLQNGQTYEIDEGTWKIGRQVGHGAQMWSLGRYDGDISNSMPNGYGILTLKGARYDGEFHNGKPNGEGSLTSRRGVFKGKWTDGCLLGRQKISVGVPLSTCL